jgi:hypothetical protein
VLPIYGALYLAMAKMLRLPEFDAFVAMVRRRFGGR